MNKTIKTSILAAAFVLFLAVPVFAQGFQESDSLVLKLVEDELVQLEDLGIANPGILQTNPFYFLKRFRRSTFWIFRFNPIRKAEFELDVLNEKIAELERSEEIIPDDREALADALDIYRDTLDNLHFYLKRIDRNDKDAGIGILLDKLLDIGLKHSKLFDQLIPKDDSSGKERLRSVQKEIASIITETLIRLDTPDEASARLSSILAKQRGGIFKGFRLAEVLDNWESGIVFSDWLKELLLQSKEELLLETQVRIDLKNVGSTLPAVFELLPGEARRRIKVLDEAREYLTDQELRNDFGAVRQLILDLSEKSRVVGKSEAGSMLNEAKEAVGFLSEKINSGNLRSKIIRELSAKAEFNLKQAEESFEIGRYASSFGQASIAAAAAKNAINQIAQESKLDSEVSKLKSSYDLLFNRAVDAGLSQKNAGQLFELLTLAEKTLAELSDLTVDGSKIDILIPILRDTKVLLMRSELVLDDLLLQLEGAARKEKSGRPLLQRVLD